MSYASNWEMFSRGGERSTNVAFFQAHSVKSNQIKSNQLTDSSAKLVLCIQPPDSTSIGRIDRILPSNSTRFPSNCSNYRSINHSINCHFLSIINGS